MSAPEEPMGPDEYLRRLNESAEPTSPLTTPGAAPLGPDAGHPSVGHPSGTPLDSPYAEPTPGAPTEPGYGQQPGYPQYSPSAGMPAYGQQPPQMYGHPGYGYGYGYPAAAPSHSSATTSMVLGILGLAGIMFCAGITLVFSPIAWAMGSKAVREIDANPGMYSGRDQANGGKIMGIIGTVLLTLGVLLIAGLIAIGIAADDSNSSSDYYSSSTSDSASS